MIMIGSSRRSAVGLAAVGLSVIGLSVLGLSGCLGADAKATEDFKCQSKPAFTGELADGGGAIQGVSAYMEQRCGTLDCHGSTYRPMRIYGRLGLRSPAEANVTGGKATTPAELDANYGSVCNVEPEKMSQAVDDFGQSAEKLLVLQKARGVEGHKGGTVVKQGSAGDECLLRWLRGDTPTSVSMACQQAIAELQ